MKDFPMNKVLIVARTISDICKEKDVLFIVNDYPDIAYLSCADGVHLGQDDLSVEDVREILPLSMLIGVSTHSIEEATTMFQKKPDYIAIGPIYDTKSKYGKTIKGIGVDPVKHLSNKIEIPLVCIGGIEPERICHLRTGLPEYSLQNAPAFYPATDALRSYFPSSYQAPVP